MTSEQYRRVSELYQAALELPPEARMAFLARVCGSDDELLREVESLLRAHELADGFIARKVADAVAEMADQPPTRSLEGRNLGHYEVLSLIGAGGMGDVYLAQDTRLGRKVALKLLPAAFSKDHEGIRRFIQEARAASSLNHPNILTIHEIGEASDTEGEAEGGAHYIVSEFVTGETLRARLRSGALDTSRAIAIVEQVASALGVAHEAGIVHRDIKPENVMVRPDGLVKVLDFGLAKLTEASLPSVGSGASTVAKLSTAPGMVMGTVSYMSPEQARGQKVDARSDIFSLGVVFYEMLAGRRPFEGETMSDVIAAVLTAEPSPLKKYCAQSTAELEEIVGKCLAKDRESRYQSAAELIAELKALSPASQTSGATKRRIKGTGLWSGSSRWLVIGAMTLFLLAGLVWFLSERRPPPVQPNQIRSLAVLPLENLSGDPAQEYFADGMTEALISNLAQVRELRVVSRTSVMRFKGSRKPLAEIARELKVERVIEGSVQRAGDRLKIVANLIDPLTEAHIWTGNYDRELTDVLRLQSEVARAIVEQIQIKLPSQERMRLLKARPINPTAYDAYLRGRFYANRQTKADNETAIITLERAVALDPNFADAQAELAQACVWRFYLFTPGEKQWEEKAFVAVEKALSLDSDSAVAHQARGRLLWTPANRFPHEKAIQEYRRALTLNPSLDEAQNQLALVYNHIGAFDQALQELQKAVTVNPGNSLVQFRIGQTLLFQGKYEQALTALQESPREANPLLVGSHTLIALLHLGRRDEAAAKVEEFLRDYPEDTEGGLFTGIQALVAALAGDANKAEAKISSAIKRGRGFGHFHHTEYNIACAYSVMKKSEPAIKWLQSAADDGFPCYQLFANDPYLDHLRQNPRFISLMAKLKAQWENYRAIL